MVVTCGQSASQSSNLDAGMVASNDAPVRLGPPALDAAVFLDASCNVVIDSPPLLSRDHVDTGVPVVYNSNPPSSGPHYASWATYGVHTERVDPRLLVHNLEHGAIVLLYKCGVPSGCPDIVAQLERVADTLPYDPLCLTTGIRARTVIAPDPLLANPIAAAAWGWVYNADCLDIPTLTAFTKAHYGFGPEATCEQGQVP